MALYWAKRGVATALLAYVFYFLFGFAVGFLRAALDLPWGFDTLAIIRLCYGIAALALAFWLTGRWLSRP